MQVIHVDDGSVHLRLNTDEVGIMVDLCFAGAFSDFLPQSQQRQRQCHYFLWDIQKHLLQSAQRLRQTTILDRKPQKAIKQSRIDKQKNSRI